MKLRALLAAVGTTAALTACLGDSTGPDCEETTLEQTGTAGDTIVLNTGLRYITVEVGTGATADWCETVAVRYEAFLLGSDEPFDASPTGQLLAFLPGRTGSQRLIAGFEQGVVGMQVGGTRRLIVPPELAYGSTVRTDNQGNVVIPANSTLVFNIELVEAEE